MRTVKGNPAALDGIREVGKLMTNPPRLGA